MNRGTIALTGLGLGAGVMYLADPQEGRRRRARLRDAIVHTGHLLEAATGRASRDIENRVAGLGARAAASLATQPPPIDDVLAARVRARIGRLVSHPGAIDVKAASGRIVLSGPVFNAEVEQLVEGVRAVSGVTQIDNQLEPHAQAGDIPALQGPGPLRLRGVPPGWARWTPTTRVMAGAAGLALMALAARRRAIRETAVGLAGFELLEQAVRGARTRL
jgi:hypothetical protein